MRKAMIATVLAVVAGAATVGVLQASGGDGADGSTERALTLAEVSRPVAGVPPRLAALRGRVNELVPGGARALDAQLRALRGHPVVVNLWASWCAPCRFELPFLQRQAIKRAARVAFLGVNSGDERAAARRLAASIPMPYPSIEDPRQSVAGRFGARGLPATAFYDAAGSLVLVHQGVFPSEAKLSAAIERYALGETPAGGPS